MTEIAYIKGDATRPQGEGRKIIIHCCNDVGGWGAGFVLALSSRWREPEEAYRAWYKHAWALTNGPAEDISTEAAFPPWQLGAVQLVSVETNLAVANIIGQRGHDPRDRPVRYDALLTGFEQVANTALREDASIHAPRLGCGLAGGDWRIVEALLNVAFTDKDIPVTVYDL